MISFTRLQSSELARFRSDVVCAHFCRSAASILKIFIRQDLLKCYEEERTPGTRMSNFFTLLRSLNGSSTENPRILEKECTPRPVDDAKEALRLLREIAPTHMSRHTDEMLLCV